MNALERYKINLIQIIETVFSSQKNVMETISQKMCECITNGHFIYLFGTGHAHMLTEEMFYRAGGLAATIPMLDEKLMLHISASKSTELEREEGYAEKILESYNITKDDLAIICSNSGINQVPVEMAYLIRQQKGATVVAITSVCHSQNSKPRNRLNKRLMEVVDFVLDNGGTIGDASVELSSDYKVGSTSTAVGAALLQAITSRCVEIAIEEHKTIDVYCSSNVEKGDGVNEKLIKKYQPMIPIL
ncbi:MAG: SIS domain-containing protein [Peptococcales bacterium]|jgi:uncharacterized phosphosugar-binding protein